jgi:hypothetical protein
LVSAGGTPSGFTTNKKKMCFVACGEHFIFNN